MLGVRFWTQLHANDTQIRDGGLDGGFWTQMCANYTQINDSALVEGYEHKLAQMSRKLGLEGVVGDFGVRFWTQISANVTQIRDGGGIFNTNVRELHTN